MHQKILVSLPEEMVIQQKIQISEQLNKTLSPILAEVKSWNGFVDFIELDDNFTFVAKCDNNDIRQKMQELIDRNEVAF